MLRTLILATALLLLTSYAIPKSTPFETANTFARAYGAWAVLAEAHEEGTYSFKEVRAWKDAESKFNDLRKQMKLEYAQ